MVCADRKTSHGKATVRLRQLWMARVADAPRPDGFHHVAPADACQVPKVDPLSSTVDPSDFDSIEQFEPETLSRPEVIAEHQPESLRQAAPIEATPRVASPAAPWMPQVLSHARRLLHRVPLERLVSATRRYVSATRRYQLWRPDVSRSKAIASSRPERIPEHQPESLRQAAPIEATPRVASPAAPWMPRVLSHARRLLRRVPLERLVSGTRRYQLWRPDVFRSGLVRSSAVFALGLAAGALVVWNASESPVPVPSADTPSSIADSATTGTRPAEPPPPTPLILPTASIGQSPIAAPVSQSVQAPALDRRGQQSYPVVPHLPHHPGPSVGPPPHAPGRLRNRHRLCRAPPRLPRRRGPADPS